MDDTLMVQCPWCWQLIELYIPSDSRGRMVEDCEVCCRPWLVEVSEDVAGDRTVQVDRAN